MVTEVVNTSVFPYSAVVSIRATFPDGRVSLGTGALVGKNDVLTATHVVYQPSYGGYARSIQVFPGADYNGTRGIMESAPYGSYFSGSVVGFPDAVFSDSNNATTSLFEVPSDIAVIGLSQTVGFQTGWFGLGPGNNIEQIATEIGYPGDGTGMMMSSHYTYSYNGLWISAYDPIGTSLLGPGSSGGPLFIQPELLPSIIGVKSSGNNTVNYWADIDHKYDALIAAINANDNLVGGSTFFTGTAANNTIAGSATNLVINGLSGIDLVTYAAPRAQYQIQITGSQQVNVINASTPTRGDTLSNVERLQFSDTYVAVDVGPKQNAGSIYMLYKAAFNRTPDAEGMGYWLAQVDGGRNIVTDIATGFVNSPEFAAKYGTNPSISNYVDSLYQNVLGRVGDPGGVAYWNQVLSENSASKAEVLHQFATLPEGAILVGSSIANGVVYQEWIG